MRVLVKCEESQAVCIEFRKLGHEAFSCDLLPCSGGHTEWHIQGDALEVSKRENWDLKIAFPPCTDLAVSGARYFEKKRLDGSQEKSIRFFFEVWKSSHAVENPIGIMSGGEYVKKWFPILYAEMILAGFPFKAIQIIQPYNFQEDASKATCLFLRGLPPLISTGYFEPRIIDGKKRWSNQTDSGQNRLTLDPFNKKGLRAKLRSKTYHGIAQAMADQWSNYLINQP